MSRPCRVLVFARVLLQPAHCAAARRYCVLAGAVANHHAPPRMRPSLPCATPCQGECMWLHLEIIKQVLESRSKLFPVSRYYFANVPTYPCGQLGFVINALEADGRLPRRFVPLRRPLLTDHLATASACSGRGPAQPPRACRHAAPAALLLARHPCRRLLAAPLRTGHAGACPAPRVGAGGWRIRIVCAGGGGRQGIRPPAAGNAGCGAAGLGCDAIAAEVARALSARTASMHPGDLQSVLPHALRGHCRGRAPSTQQPRAVFEFGRPWPAVTSCPLGHGYTQAVPLNLCPAA